MQEIEYTHHLKVSKMLLKVKSLVHNVLNVCAVWDGRPADSGGGGGHTPALRLVKVLFLGPGPREPGFGKVWVHARD